MPTDKRYQVFVSSTFIDLVDERREITQALLELDCIPSGMELFPAADEDQWSLIKRVIDDCDYYIVVLAGRYGSVASNGQSYTEMEYRYALARKKPIIGFIYKDKSTLPLERSEKSLEGQNKLSAFEDLVKKKPIRFWSSAAELGSVVSRSVNNLIKTNPSAGWIRGGSGSDDEGSLKKIIELQNQLEKLRKTDAATNSFDTSRLRQGDDLLTVNCQVEFLDKSTGEQKSWGWRAEATFNDMFKAASSVLLDGAFDDAIKKKIEYLLLQREWKDIRKDRTFKKLEYKSFSVEDDDFQSIKIQMIGLGLIQKVARAVNSHVQKYILTASGEQLMFQVRALPKASGPQADEKIPGLEIDQT